MNQNTSYSYTFSKDGTMEHPSDGVQNTGNSDGGRETGESNKDAGEPQFNCAICLDQPVDPVVTMCGHMFCWECIREVRLFPRFLSLILARFGVFLSGCGGARRAPSATR